MHLSEKERRIFCALQLQANAPFARIAQLTGYKEHTVRYALHSMRERGVFYPSIMIEEAGFGLEKYEMFLRVTPRPGQSVAVLEAAIADSSTVRWMGKVAGDYDYWLWLHVGKFSEIEDHFDNLIEKFGNIFSKKLLGRYVSWRQYGKKYLLPSIKIESQAGCSSSIARYQASQNDLRIISVLSHDPLATIGDLSRRLSVSSSTIAYRLNCLRKSGILGDPFLRLSYASSGIQAYLIRIKTKFPSAKVQQRLMKYALEHPHIVVFTHHVGSWDYGLTVEVEAPELIHQITADLHRNFAEAMESLILLSRFDPIKSTVDPTEALAHLPRPAQIDLIEPAVRIRPELKKNLRSPRFGID